MSDLMREEFTKWAAGKFEIPESLIVWTEEHPDDGFPVRVVNEQGEDSDEVNSLFGIAWLAFQASRAALVVELPEERSTVGKHFEAWSYAQDYNDGIEACREAITAAGVTVK